MPQVDFEPMIPMFERAKTVHVLDHAATVIGHVCFMQNAYSIKVKKVKVKLTN
jgi:hypothetical protein